MDVKQVLHMNRGEGETSYARNSLPQRSVILKTKPLIEAAALEFFSATKAPISCVRVADLGCSSGPNSLLPTTLIVDAVRESCRKLGLGSPQFQVFLNDLPGNDFNTIFGKMLPSFYGRLKEEEEKLGGGIGPCFVSMTAGSFYDRLFPDETLHFLYCVNSLHWLSQVPSRLVDELAHLNKGELALGKTSEPAIFDAYSEQFRKDFASFLRSRSREMVPGGRAILTLLGRRTSDPFAEENYSAILDDLSSSLRELAAEGVVEEERLASFNLPYYEPHLDEVEDAVRAEGSFEAVRLEEVHRATELDGDEHCRSISHKTTANCFRAVLEPVLASHFGGAIMGTLFDKFEERLSRREVHMLMALFVSLVKKA